MLDATRNNIAIQILQVGIISLILNVKKTNAKHDIYFIKRKTSWITSNIGNHIPEPSEQFCKYCMKYLLQVLRKMLFSVWPRARYPSALILLIFGSNEVGPMTEQKRPFVLLARALVTQFCLMAPLVTPFFAVLWLSA